MRNSEQIRSLTKAADNGCAESAFEAFKELRKYKDSVDAIRESIFYLRKSAYGGHAEAQFYYSEYLKRSQSAKLMEQSIEWLKKAADSGYPKAMYYLGCFYKDGFRVRKNRKSAIKWLTLASAYGHVMAKNVLDALREEGDRSSAGTLHHRFDSLANAWHEVEQWSRFSNNERPHQSLGYAAPSAHPALTL